MSLLRTITTVLVVGAIAGSVYFAIEGSPSSGPAEGRRGRGDGGFAGPVSVVAKNAEIVDVPIYLDGVGAVKGLNTATVRAQVDGRLLSVNFNEGQDVKKGEVLAKIDPVTYQASLDQAIAKKALDEALLANSKRDLERFQKVGTLAVSQQQIDTQIALIAQQEAQIKSDVAAIENATAIVGYTTIVAPFDGRTGIRLIDEGNLVHAGDAGGIVVITQVQPISVLFTLPQQQLPTLTKAIVNQVLTAQALSTDNQTELDVGTLKVIDNQVDQQTGTIRLKAEFPNNKRQLWPGQFVNVRLLVDTLKGVVVAPTEAIQRGPNGAYVYVIGPDSTVSMRQVTIARQDEKHAVIAQGVTAGEKLVTAGFSRLKDGSTVSVSDANMPSPADSSQKPGQLPEAKKSSEIDGNRQALETPDAAPLMTGSTSEAEKRSGKRHHRRDGGASP